MPLEQLPTWAVVEVDVGRAGRLCRVTAYAQPISLDAAVELTRTGDIWIFRGHSAADRAIQTLTNAPVNHVGMAVVLEDLPPLMWHAELGQALEDVWTGTHHRGVQLHDLRAAVTRWQHAHGQRAWLRQLSPDVERVHEDALLRAVARLDGVSFPGTARLAWRWVRGRDAHVSRRARMKAGARPEVAYCAEVVASTYADMGLLDPSFPVNWYDPGAFWSGDALPLRPGWALGEEIPVASASA